MITWVASYPRSGNSFVCLLLNRFFGIQVYNAYFPPVTEPDSDESKHLQQLMGQAPLPAELPELFRSPRRYFIKTHDLPPDDAPAIYVARDGRDALVSYAWYALTEQGATAPKEAGRFLATLRGLIEDQATFGGWSGHVKAWTCRAAPTVVLKYEEMVRDPQAAVAAIAPAAGSVPAPSGDLFDFDYLHREVPWFFRKGKAGGWREEMPPDVEDRFWIVHGEAMLRLGYQREAAPDEIRTGRGWHEREDHGGESFRWVDNDAELIVPHATGRYSALWVEAEPGPGLGGGPLLLRMLDSDGNEVSRAAPAIGRSRLELALPEPANGSPVYRLHVDGGGRRLPDDPRILNFRVFGYGWD